MSEKYKFQLLAPCDGGRMADCRADEQAYARYMSGLQRLRASVYLNDGAIQPGEIDDEGRFIMPRDRDSWHFLLIEEDEVIGCARYLVHSNPDTLFFERLRLARSPIASHPHWREKVRKAVEADLRCARENDFVYVEIGGWALAERWRGTAAALEILVASYALGHIWGGALGACMATVRHSSSSILRRIGGASFQVAGEPLPAYADAQYGCLMELLRFDSRSPAARFLPLINQLKRKLKSAMAISPKSAHPWESIPHEFPSEQVSFPKLATFYC